MFRFLLLISLTLLLAISCAPAVAPTPAPTQAPTTAPVLATTSAPTAAPTQTLAPKKSGKIRLMVIANSDIRDIPMAQAVDTLKAQGYQVEVTQMVNGTLITEALARGDAELGSFNNQTIWTAVAKGVKAKTIMQRLSFPNIIVAPKETKDCRVLDGKPFAISAQTGLNPILIEQYLQRKCPNTKSQYLVIPDSGGRLAALTTGAVSAALMPLEEFLKVQQDAPGKYATLVDLTQEFPLLQVNGVHARGDWLEQNPEAAKDFVRATLLAHRYAIANPSIMYDKVVEQIKVDRNTAKVLVDAYISVNAWDPNGVLTRENVQYTLDFLKDIKAVPTELQYADIADLSILEAVLKEIGRK